MGKEKFLSEMSDCVASKAGLERLVGLAGCEWTGTKCRLQRVEGRVAGGGASLPRPSTLAPRHSPLDTRPPHGFGLFVPA
jgi:hypothetical protein